MIPPMLLHHSEVAAAVRLFKSGVLTTATLQVRRYGKHQSTPADDHTRTEMSSLNLAGPNENRETCLLF